MKLIVIISNGYTATTPQLKGCIGEGDTIEEAQEDFVNALFSLLEAYHQENMPPPWEYVDRKARKQLIKEIARLDGQILYTYNVEAKNILHKQRVYSGWKQHE